MNSREKSVCFTGHRPEKICEPFSETAPISLDIRRQLHQRILQAIDDGYTTFLCGMAQGVDLWAGEIVLSLQESIRYLELIAVLPYSASVKNWPLPWRNRYQQILKFCNETIVICPEYRRDCFHLRNRYMVEHTNRLIGVWREGSPGGTQYTIKYAKEQKLELDLILLP